MKLKSLLILAPPVPPHHIGGDGKFALDIATELSKKGQRVAILTPFYNGRFIDERPNDFLRIIRIPISDPLSKNPWDVPIWDPEFTIGRDEVLLEHIRNLNLINKDVWVHEIGGSIYNRLLLTLKNQEELSYSCHIQIVLENYDKLIPNNRDLKKLTLESQRLLIKNASMVFFLSKFDFIPFQYDVKDYRIVPNGVELSKFVFKKQVERDTRYRIFIGGRLHDKMKGAAKMFPILNMILEKEKMVELHVCAPDKTYFEHFSTEAMKHIHYHGWISVQKTQEIIGRCNLSLVPSLYEPFGLLALESLANGIPVLGTKTGGLSEMIIPNTNGNFIDTQYPNKVRTILEYYISHKNNLQRRDIQDSIRMTIEKYDIKNIADLYLNNLGGFLASEC